MNMLQIQFFAEASRLMGSPKLTIPWSDDQTVLQLKQFLAETYPNLRPLVPQLLVAVNNDYANDNATIKTNDEVACFPPVSGG